VISTGGKRFQKQQRDRRRGETARDYSDCGPIRSKSGLGRRDKISGLYVVAEAIENQALEEFGYTGGERDWTKGG